MTQSCEIQLGKNNIGKNTHTHTHTHTRMVKWSWRGARVSQVPSSIPARGNFGPPKEFSACSCVLLSSLEQGGGDVLSCGSQRYPKIRDNELQTHSVKGKADGDREYVNKTVGELHTHTHTHTHTLKRTKNIIYLNQYLHCVAYAWVVYS